MKRLIAFLKDENGLETSEYAVMGALIILTLVLAVQGLSTAIGDSINGITDVIDNGVSAS